MSLLRHLYPHIVSPEACRLALSLPGFKPIYVTGPLYKLFVSSHFSMKSPIYTFMMIQLNKIFIFAMSRVKN